MGEGSFIHWDDPLKHYVRLDGWLPLCEKRLAKMRSLILPKKQKRRLRYFTFCATTAIDVLMLDNHKVFSSDGNFNNVTFFDYEPEDVATTLERIPGAVGFAGDFIETVLYNNVGGEGDPLTPLTSQKDEEGTHKGQVIKDQHQKLITRFPFDVMNFDLGEFLFKPGDPRPGKVVRALRRAFQWQQQGFTIPNSRTNLYLDEFSLMFTTQIGPPNISDDYLGMLQGYLEDNLKKFDGLGPILTDSVGYDNIPRLRHENFEKFFKLAMPKVLANILLENDWYVDPKNGIKIYEFQRPAQHGAYTMLHLVMDVKRKNPSIDKRNPGEDCIDALNAYETLTYRLFRENPIQVTQDVLDMDRINESLSHIEGRATKYMAGEVPTK
jgi:hypothetical protein